MNDLTGQCVHCGQEISRSGTVWVHNRYSTRAAVDLRQCMLYAAPKT